jgi:DNA-binding MarR family transcriptional regulator
MPNGRTVPGPRYQALLQLLRTAETLWNASRVFFDRWDLGPSQFNLLNVLSGFPKGLSQTELSRTLIMHRSNVTGLVDRLEGRGLLRRESCADDRRANRVLLTTKGQELLDEVLPHYYAAAEQVWGRLSVQRVGVLLAELQQLSDSAEQLVKN